jgi:hypothetical protein
MGRFLEREKPRLTEFKANSPYFTQAARADGIYRDHPYPFCLPKSCAAENLLSEIRDPIRAYFARNDIKWHDGQDGNPSDHLCDSQVCCVNFLFPFSDKPTALAELLRPVFPLIQEMLPIEDGQYIACEWIGQQNYLAEKSSRNRKRTRGANFTSADAAVRFRDRYERIHIVLIEWKYTEAYFSTPLAIARSGTDRTQIYAHLYEREDCPLVKERIPQFKALFYEPFYQLMRQQFLAHEMEKAHELEADTVSLLHIAPAINTDFKRVTSPSLKSLGNSATEVWGKLVKDPRRFTSISTETLFGKFDSNPFPELANWREYTLARYPWVKSV